jgi:Undecaprenyl-phosphate galactose phosphotransferase WbaP
MLTDAVCMFAVWVFDVWFYQAIGFGRYRYGPEYFLQLWPALPVFVALNALFRLYQGSMICPGAPVPPVEEMRRLAASALITHIGIIAYIALTRQTMKEISRVVTVFSGVLTALAVQPARDFTRWILFRFKALRIPVAVAGDDDSARSMKRILERDVYSGLQVVRTFGPGEARKAADECRRLGVRTLFSCEDESLFRSALADYASWFVRIERLPSAVTLPVVAVRAVSFGGVCGLELVNQRQMKALRVQKWLLDKALSVAAFILLLPFFVVVPLLVKLTSRGPVFYRQNRLGRHGRPIRVWKFRSMYADADSRLVRLLAEDSDKKAEWEDNFKLADDPRVTPLGRFLRRTSIDEIPQLFNVFAGDMALVGPRPIVRQEVEKYGEAYAVFSSVTPGITGLWQTSGRSDTDYGRRIALDTYYVLNWSPWLDLWIMKQTVGAVLSLRGAC